MELTNESRQVLLKGALFGVKVKNNPKETLKTISLWIALEDFVGDKDFSFRLALTVPNSCEYAHTTESVIKLHNHESAVRLLTKIRMTFFVQSKRSEQMKMDVI